VSSSTQHKNKQVCFADTIDFTVMFALKM